MKPETLKRWGVVLKGRGKNPDLLLPLGWPWRSGTVYANAQPWPAVWMTRKEAEAAALVRRECTRSHNPRWRFRVVRISMTVRVMESSR